MNPLFEKFAHWLRWPSDATSLYRVSFWILSMIVAGLLAVLTNQSEIVWGLSALASGGLLGFLFGIPRVQQQVDRSSFSESEGDVPMQVAYSQSVNTNLTEISDWLTKIIVGVSLVQMTRIPPAFESLVIFLSGNKHDPGFISGVLVFFGVAGFLSGYLITRLFLAAAFSEADRAANNFNLKSTQLPPQIGSQPNNEVLDQILRSPREAVLDNWELLMDAAKYAIRKRDPDYRVQRQTASVISKLLQLEILDRDQASIFEELRQLRNIAAHSSQAISVEAAIDYVSNAKRLTESITSTAENE